jgi:hypothetical protein
MMKKIALFALISTAVTAPAMAESSDVATINLTGTIPQICTVVPNASIAGQSGGAAATYSVSGDDVTTGWTFLIANTNDPTLETIGDTSQRFFSVAFETFCNDNFTWSTQATNGSLINGDGSAPVGFTGELDYRLNIKQTSTGSAGQNAGQNLSAGQTFIYTSDAYDGISQIDVTVPGTTTPPVAGDYVETLTLTFQAD